MSYTAIRKHNAQLFRILRKYAAENVYEFFAVATGGGGGGSLPPHHLIG